ncbi:MAG TPA: cupredoxin domain-containing protein [Thermaerobacter sp.]
MPMLGKKTGKSWHRGACPVPAPSRAAVALGMALALLAGCLPGAGGPRTVTIEMLPDFRYEPREVVVRPGETVRLVLRNRDDRLPHEFRSAQRVTPDLRVAPGQAHELRWTAPAEPVAIAFWCGMPGHRKNGMAGRIVVR